MPNAALSEREPVGGGLHRVRLSIDAETAATHKHHAQYVELRHDGLAQQDESETTAQAAVKGTFVLASTPGSTTWDVVVKEGGAMADRLRNLPLSTTLVTSAAQGKGFPFASVHGRPLVLAATGSGIAAMLSTIGARIDGGASKKTFVLWGVREKKDVALNAELEAMRRAGVEVAICLSREHIDEPGFFKGYVQHVAGERGWAVQGGVVFAAGNKAMIEGMREAMGSLGLTREDVLLNF
jgi:NAD(P)H-flavin reductase